MRRAFVVAALLLFCPGGFAGTLGVDVLAVTSGTFKLNEAEIAGSDAVLLSVRGLSFIRFGYGIELRHIKGAVDYLSGHKNDISNMKGFEQFMSVLRQADPYSYAEPLYIPDSYLGDFLKVRMPETGRKFAIVPLDWNRDADDSRRQCELIEQWTEKAYDMAARYHKPVYIVAHSWGSVLMHSALNRLAEKNSPVRIEKWVTMGSPLRPSFFWMKVGTEIGLVKSGLELKVHKPANVKYWVNLWALRDRISNAIPAADANIRVDEDADRYRSALRKIIDSRRRAKHAAAKPGRAASARYDGETMLGISSEEFNARMDGEAENDKDMPSGYRQARSDLKLLNSTVVWHGSYFSGVVVNFKSMNKSYRNDVVRKYFLPQFR
ncbi:MAG: hypothetical protein PHW69_03910 [Elusimicrobiaceae bacterium]|nr:hypothetical protein [Elusimicrobiaceae bacterium]